MRNTTQRIYYYILLMRNTTQRIICRKLFATTGDALCRRCVPQDNAGSTLACLCRWGQGSAHVEFRCYRIAEANTSLCSYKLTKDLRWLVSELGSVGSSPPELFLDVRGFDDMGLPYDDIMPVDEIENTSSSSGLPASGTVT